MNIEHYTPIHFSKRPLHFFQLFSLHFESLLLSFLVLTGIIGSIYLFGQNINNSNKNYISGFNNQPTNSSLAGLFLATDEEDTADNFDDFIKMEGKASVGTAHHFDFLKDERASRYVMEMGDGVRLIVTQKKLQHTYTAPGKYVIELKEIKGGLLHLIGTKKIKVK